MKMILMYKTVTPNGLDITEEMILNSLHTFKNKPLVLNKNQELKNYTNDEVVEKFNKDYEIGMVVSAEYNKENGIVEGEVIFRDTKYARDEFDNWQITLSDDKKSFILNSIEIFE